MCNQMDLLIVAELVRLSYPVIGSTKQLRTSTTSTEHVPCSAKVMAWQRLKARRHPLCEQASPKCAGVADSQMPGSFF